jgi:hypothetical protein
MATINTREKLIDYCKRRLGDPVIEINVDEDQVEDRIDEALQLYREYHSDGQFRTFLKHQITADDLTNKYITLPDTILTVNRLFPVASSLTGRDMFSLQYQMHLNDIAFMGTFMGDIAYFKQINQYLSLLDMTLNGTPQVDFSRVQNRLYIQADLEDGTLSVGDYIVVEAIAAISPTQATKIYDDRWLKEYSTALIKLQWGQNLIKFDGVQLPGGVTINARQIYEDATADIDKLREELRSEHEMPIDFYVG